MLLHKNHKFIYNNVAAIEIPNNVYFDCCPDPCPIEGMVFHTADMRAEVDINFIKTSKDARTYLEEGTEGFSTVECVKPVSDVSTNGIDGFTMTYTTDRYSYEEYVFTLPGDDLLLSICIEQKRENPADPELCAQLVAELLAGIQII